LCGTLSGDDFTVGVENCEGIGKVNIWHRETLNNEQPTDSTRPIVIGLAQLWRMDFYALKRFLGMGQGKFQELAGL